MEHFRSITGARLDRFPRPCLGSAAALAVPTVVAKLLSGRADPQEVARDRSTALHEALSEHVEDRPHEAVAECAQLLLQHKADLHSKDAADRTPLDLLLLRDTASDVFWRMAGSAELIARAMGSATVAALEAAKLAQRSASKPCFCFGPVMGYQFRAGGSQCRSSAAIAPRDGRAPSRSRTPSPRAPLLGATASSSGRLTASKRCPACQWTHEPNEGWDFCWENLDGSCLFEEERDREFVTSLCRLPSCEEREFRYFLCGLDNRNSWSFCGDEWVVQAQEEPPETYVALAAELSLPSVLATLLGSRANPNATMPPRRSSMDDVFFENRCALHCVVRPDMPAPFEARAACVKELMKHRADLQLQDIYGSTPLDLLLRHERRCIQEGWQSHRELAEIMDPSAQAAFEFQREQLLHQRVWLYLDCLCRTGLGDADDRGGVFRPGDADDRGGFFGMCCEKCFPRVRTPAFRCDACKVWTPATPDQHVIESSAARARQICAQCRRAPRKCACCEKEVASRPGQRVDLKCTYAYCSDACRFPRCSGPGANGKGCKAERPNLRRIGRPLRFDEDRNWRCKACQKRK